MRFRLITLLLCLPLLLCASVSGQAGQVVAEVGCSDNQSASTADLLPVQASCSRERFLSTAYEAVTAQGSVDQYSLSTGVSSFVHLNQDGSVLSQYQSVWAARRDHIWFDPAEYPDPIVVRMTWAVDTGVGDPQFGASNFQARFGPGGDSEFPQCDFLNGGLQNCVVTRTLTPGRQGGVFLVIGMSSSVGYINIIGSAGDEVNLLPGATAQLGSVEILDQNMQPLDAPPTLFSDFGFTYNF